MLGHPSIHQAELTAIDGENDWRTFYLFYLVKDELPEGILDVKKFKRLASYYTIIHDQLYRRGHSLPLLIYTNQRETKNVMEEVQGGICGNHIGGQSLAAKIL